MRPFADVMDASVVLAFSIERVEELPERMSGAEMVTLPAVPETVTASEPVIVRLPPVMPTGAVELMVSEPIERSPPRSVLVEFEEPVAEKMMSESDVKFSVGVPVALLDQLLPADQRVPFEPLQ
jgi:hypothetical protein